MPSGAESELKILLTRQSGTSPSAGSRRSTSATPVRPVGHSEIDRCTLTALEEDLAVKRAALGLRCFDHPLAHGNVRAVAQDQTAWPGCTMVSIVIAARNARSHGKRAKVALLT